jgi:thiamine biosynthesis protein ThiC
MGFSNVKARYSLDWESQIKLSIDPQKARIIREERATKTAAALCVVLFVL